MPKEARDKANAELNKLKLMSPMSAEATVVRNYIDWLVKVPWKKRTKITARHRRAPRRCWTKITIGLEKVKERIVEYLAVQQRVKTLQGPDPVSGRPAGRRQDLARPEHRARDQPQVRAHVARRRARRGGDPRPPPHLHRLDAGQDRAEHGARTGVRNPLFLLDEVDKMAMDFRGDPSSALLEVLDPEQNSTFNDHYLEVDFDLSEVMFVCTANSLNIPAPLLDRMEVIRIPGYTEDEKLNIARRYLLPKQIKANGLKPEELKISDGGDPRHHPLLHARGGRPQSRARDLEDLPQGRSRSCCYKPTDKSRSTSRRSSLREVSRRASASATGRPRRTTTSARSRASPGPKSAASC